MLAPQEAPSLLSPTTKYLPNRDYLDKSSICLVRDSRENALEQTYFVLRVNLLALEVTKQVRDRILQAMNEGKKYVQIDEITLMLNSIASIEPGRKRERKVSRADEILAKYRLAEKQEGVSV